MVGEGLKLVLGRDADLSACRQRLRTGSHSFYAASLLLPREFRQPITALYAFCRVADDSVDQARNPKAGLNIVRRRLARIYAGRPKPHPVDRAFAEVVRERQVPLTLPDALLEGFEWDAAGRRYETLSDTYAYCARVAGTVGVMVAMLMGVRRTDVLSRACDLGVAMQLTNIARDVGEDARAGRVYLPTDRLAAHGVDAARWLADPRPLPGVARVVQELLASADDLYRRAEWGIAQLPVRVRPAMFAARTIYAEIGREVERAGLDSVTRRAVVPRRRKLVLLAAAIARAARTRREDEAPPLSETRFLLDAVASQT